MRNRITRSRLKFSRREEKLDFSNISSHEEIRERLTYLSKYAEDTRAQPFVERSLNPSDSSRAVRTKSKSRIQAIYANYREWLEGKVTLKTEGYRKITSYDSPFAYVFNPPAVYYANVKREIPKMIKKTLDLINYYKYSYRRYTAIKNKRSKEASDIQVYLLQWSKYIQDYLDFMHDTFGHLIGLKNYDVSTSSAIYDAYKDLVYLYSTNRGYERTDERGVLKDPEEIASMDSQNKEEVLKEYPGIFSILLDQLNSVKLREINEAGQKTTVNIKNVATDDFFDAFLKDEISQEDCTTKTYKDNIRPEFSMYEEEISSLYFISKKQIDRLNSQVINSQDKSILESACDDPEKNYEAVKGIAELKPKISNALGTLKYLIYTAFPDQLSVLLLKTSNENNPIYDLTLLLLRDSINLYNKYVKYSAVFSLSEIMEIKNKSIEMRAKKESILSLIPKFSADGFAEDMDFAAAGIVLDTKINSSEKDAKEDTLDSLEEMLDDINYELKNMNRIEQKNAEKLISLEARIRDMLNRSSIEDLPELENNLRQINNLKDAVVGKAGENEMNKQSSIKPLSRSSVVFKKVNTDYLPLRLSESDSDKVAEDKALVIMGNLLTDEKENTDLIKSLKRVYEFEKMEDNLLRISEYFKEENTLYDKLSVDLILVSGSIYNVYKFLIDTLNRKPSKPPVQFAPFIPVEGLDGVQVAPFLVASYTLGGGT